jgi:hypothetical protein
MTNVRDIDLARARVCYLVRGLWKRVDWDAIPKERRRNLTSELAEQLYPLAISERSTLGWTRALAARFHMGLVSTAWSTHPASAVLPEMFVEPGAPREEGPEDSPQDHVRVRWDALVRQIPFEALRMALHDGAALVATFATTDPVDDEASLFPVAQADAQTKRWVSVLPKALLSPRSFRAVWTVVSPLHHGHDEKSGNVSLFRRERTVDPTTGEVSLVPFVSGNAVRGLWRDRLFSRLLSLVGMKFSEMPPQRAHALLSGGTIEAGTDGTKVDVGVRRRAREICPAWDLIAGCIDGQIMRGLLVVSDAELVCRENAWKLHAALAPNEPFEAFRASLPVADDLTQLRILTRHAHRDIEKSDGHQMIVNVEGILPGAQLVQRFSLHGLDGVSELARSCMADLLEEFRSHSFIGAKNASGYGEVAFDGYLSDAIELPPASLYLSWVAERTEEIRAWLLGGKVEEPPAEEEPTKKRGRTKKVETEAGVF